VVKGFRNFVLRGDVVVLAIGLVVALAFSTLIVSFTTNVITPIVNRAQGKVGVGLGVQLGASGNPHTFINLGAFISSVIYFLVFMVVIYLVLVVPYKRLAARQGRTVFGDPTPTKTCPACLSDDLPAAASKCRYCGTEQPASQGTSA
jgi:large conductance mechanosensitive channel